MARGTNTPRAKGFRAYWLDVTVGGVWRSSWFVLTIAALFINMSTNASPPSSGGTGSPGDVPRSRVWSVIENQIDKLTELPPASDGNELRKRLDRAAAAVAERSDRKDIEQMLRTAKDALPGSHSSGEPGLAAWLSGMAIARIADPNNEHLFISRSRRWGVGEPSAGKIEWHALAVAAVDLYHDQDSFALLLELALSHNGAHGMSDGHWDSPIVESCGFLRAYVPDKDAIQKVEQHMRESKQDGVIAAQKTLHAKYLQALIASWDYAKGLSEPRRRQYHDFERRLWRAWSLSRGGFTLKHGRFFDAAALLTHEQGDESFFLRIFESAESTPEEVLIAEYAMPSLSEEGKQRLQAVATGDSLWAGNAARALKRVK